jgi:sugar phosphate isomerase/epimerase
MCTDPRHQHHLDTPAAEEVAGLSRRGFLRTAAAGAAVVGVAGATGALAGPAAAAPATTGAGGAGRGRVPAGKISIQLYTVRDELAADFDGTLDRLAGIGYRHVEHAGFVGRSAAEFKAALAARGIRATSGHVGIPQPFDAAAWAAALADARLLGSTYIVHPFFGVDADGPIRDRAVWSAFAADLNRAGRQARAAGLRFGYHNHNFEFFRLNDGSGQTAYDVLIAETDPRYVHFEMDLFWVTRGAVDPVDLLRRVGRRVRQYHVKDMNSDGSFEDAGQGLLDFARIFRAHPVDEYIVERDDAGTAPRQPADALTTAEVGYDFLRAVRF